MNQPQREGSVQVQATSTDTGADRSTTQLVKDLSEQTSHLVRTETRLAVRELTDKARRGAVGGGLAAAGGILAFYAGAALLAAAVLAIAIKMPAWLAALIVGAATLLAAGVVGLTGALLVKKSTPPTPDRAIDGLRADVDVVKERIRK